MRSRATSCRALVRSGAPSISSSPGRSVDGGRRGGPGAVCDAHRCARRARHVDYAVLWRPERVRSSSTSTGSLPWGPSRADHRGRERRGTWTRHHPLERELEAARRQRRMVYACGPEPMLEAVAHIASKYGTPITGVGGARHGMRHGRLLQLRHSAARGGGGQHYVRSCLAGPVFAGADVVWDE